MPARVINVVVAGLGGQGAIKASDILAAADIRKYEKANADRCAACAGGQDA